MTESEFNDFIEREPLIRDSIQTAVAGQPRQIYSLPFEIAIVALVYPVLSLIIRGVGLPWMQEAVRYSELWRLRVASKIDDMYRHRGVEAERAKATADALRRELESTTNTDARAAWERLASLLEHGDHEED